MRNKESVLKYYIDKDKGNGDGHVSFDDLEIKVKTIYSAMLEYAKETSIEFFKWNTEKENYSAILRNNPSNEKQYEKEFEEAEYFDCLTPEERYNLFIKSIEGEK